MPESTIVPTDAELCRRARAHVSESQQQFGERMGYSQTAVSRWELGTLEVPKLVVAECRRILGE